MLNTFCSNNQFPTKFEEKTYLSCNSPCNDSPNADGPSDVHTLEFLNTISTFGLPSHKLRLKVGAPVMLLRNIDKKLGLCNGTRLIITKNGHICIGGKGLNWN